jgi:TonB family protein
MKPSANATVRLATLVAASLLPITSASAQLAALDGLASDISKELKSLKPRLVAVADFRPVSGGTQPQGHYFALLLSNFLDERSKKNFSVANHGNFDTDLANLHLSAESLVPGPAFSSAASGVGADVLITGTFEKRDRNYILQVTPIRVSDGKVLAIRSQTIVSSEFLESLVTPFPPDVQNAPRGNYRKGAGIPSCAYCPNPSYSDLARSKKIQGTCIVEVLVSAEGDPQQVRPLRLLGYGLDEQAFETIKQWKFHPATKEDGTPVPIIVPVEVSFRLY